jgi:hypothetical protein
MLQPQILQATFEVPYDKKTVIEINVKQKHTTAKSMDGLT